MKVRLCVGLLLVVFSVVFILGCGDSSSYKAVATRVPFISVADSGSSGVGLSARAMQSLHSRKMHRTLHASIRAMYMPGATITIGSVLTDGTDEKSVTTQAGWFDDVGITPDGKSLVYIHYPVEANSHIDKIDVDGTNNVALSSGDVEEGWTMVSPKGDKIYYVDTSGYNYQLYQMNLDGTGKAKVFNLPDICQHEANISPDGNYFVLDMHNDIGTVDGTYIIKADGTNPVKIANWDDVPIGDATFTPNGNNIMYTAWDANDMYQIVSVDLTGANKTPLTNDATLNSGHPMVYGGNIVFMRGNDTTGAQLFSANASISNPKQITTGDTLKTFHVRLVYGN